MPRRAGPLLRRWWAAIAVTVLGIGAGAAGALEIMRSLAGALVLPLAWCAATGSALTAAALPAQTLAGAGLVWVLHPLLLPRRWLDAERALPLPRSVQRRSDLALVALALLPWLALQAFGVVSLLAAHPPWLHGHRVAALVAVGAATLGSLFLGVVLHAWLESALETRTGGATQAFVVASHERPVRAPDAVLDL